MLLLCPGTYIRRRQTIVMSPGFILGGHYASFCFLFAKNT